MRTKQQIERLMSVYFSGGSKTQALIAAGYSPRSARSNACKVLPPRVNQRRIQFARNLFLCNWNKARAAVGAGYSPRWAKTNTARLMKHDEVKREILRIRQRLFPKDYPTKEQ